VHGHCHKENPYVANLNKQKCQFFFLLKNWRTGKQNRFYLGGGTSKREEEVGKDVGG
jgi:hypothetical protein